IAGDRGQGHGQRLVDRTLVEPGDEVELGLEARQGRMPHRRDVSEDDDQQRGRCRVAALRDLALLAGVAELLGCRFLGLLAAAHRSSPSSIFIRPPSATNSSPVRPSRNGRYTTRTMAPTRLLTGIDSEKAFIWGANRFIRPRPNSERKTAMTTGAASTTVIRMRRSACPSRNSGNRASGRGQKVPAGQVR